VRIAIDGPVASGKSTIGRNLATALGYLYLDTGAMYRAVTALALDRGLDLADETAITALARAVQLGFPEIDQARAVNPPLLADGIDITSRLRTAEVERGVSAVSAYRGVREALVERQRAIARERSVVMVGRDIGTVVLPDAEIKIFLTAGVEERALRRHQERIAAGIPDDLAATLEDLKRRDRLDSERPISPLRPAEDAIQVDTTGLESDQSLARVLAIVRERLGEIAP
jgi:cytidylate kinase